MTNHSSTAYVTIPSDNILQIPQIQRNFTRGIESLTWHKTLLRLQKVDKLNKFDIDNGYSGF